MTAQRTDHRQLTGGFPLRVLVALHGYEPPDWAAETCRLLSTWAAPSVRLLAVLDVPRPPFTSLTGYARRAYNGARAQWTAIEAHRLEGRIETLLRALPRGTEVAREPAARGDLAWTIAAHAQGWPADVVVVGAPAPGLRSWLRPGPVHQRVVRLAACTVVVTSAPGEPAGSVRRAADIANAAPTAQRA